MLLGLFRVGLVDPQGLRSHPFPLYAEAVRYFRHPDNMVRTAVRTITLSVYRVKDEAMREYVCTGHEADYPTHLVLFLRAEILRLNAALTGGCVPCVVLSTGSYQCSSVLWLWLWLWLCRSRSRFLLLPSSCFYHTWTFLSLAS